MTWCCLDLQIRNFFEISLIFKVATDPKNLEQDEAQCALEAERNVAPLNAGTNITINTASNLSKKERQELAQERAAREDSARWERESKIEKLKDLCLKARGWTWIDVKDK